MFISLIGRSLFQINVTDVWEVILKILTAGQFFAFFNFSYEPSIAITLALTNRWNVRLGGETHITADKTNWISGESLAHFILILNSLDFRLHLIYIQTRHCVIKGPWRLHLYKPSEASVIQFEDSPVYIIGSTALKPKHVARFRGIYCWSISGHQALKIIYLLAKQPCFEIS